MALLEETAINQLAALERSIVGVKNSYNYSANPDVLAEAQLPAVLHIIPSFTSELSGHHNRWRNTLKVLSILFVKPRLSKGGQLKFLENDVIPFGEKWRTKFQTDANIKTLFAQLSNSTQVYLAEGEYGAGPPMLQFACVDYFGWVFTFQIVEDLAQN